MDASFWSVSAQRTFEWKSRETLRIGLHQTAMYSSWRALDPGPAADVDRRYAGLPILTKADIRESFPYGVVPNGKDLDAALASGEVSFIKTSGTSAEALTNIWNQEWWDASERASWQLNSTAARVATGDHREAILASALSVGPRSEGPQIPRDKRILGRFLFLNEYGSTEEWPAGHEKRILAELADYAPAVLEANPSLLARLARWAYRAGARVWQPGLITLTYEFPSRLQLRAIRRVFGCPIASSHGSTEAGYVFMECEHGMLHQNSEFCRVDFVPVPGLARTTGRLIVSTFGNEWFPLIRFAIGDLGEAAAEPCPCGRRTGLTLSSIEGRTISVCTGADGRLVTHGQVDRALAEVEGLSEYRLDQDEPASLRLRAVAEGRGDAAVKTDSRDALAALFGEDTAIKVDLTVRMTPESSGKFLLVKRAFPIPVDAGVPERERA